MSTKENKDLILRIWKSFEETIGDADKMRAYYNKHYSANTIFHGPKGDMTLEQRTSFMISSNASFPDSKFEADDMVAEGDKVAIRYTWKATHAGTGKKIAVKGFEIDRIASGKIAEIWELLDTQGMMTQLGIAPGAKPETRNY